MHSETIQPSRPNVGLKLIAGAFLALLGIVLTANNLDLVDADSVLRYWPVVLIAAGTVKAVEPGGAIAGVILILAGASILGFNLGFLRFTIFDLWPLILIAIGVVMVANATGLLSSVKLPQNFAAFSQQKVAETTSDFRGAKIGAMFGGYELDLTGADITSGPAVLDLFVMWGGIEIFVPDDWEIVSELSPIMAGVEVRAGRTAAVKRRTLILRGFAMMAGVEVKGMGVRRTA